MPTAFSVPSWLQHLLRGCTSIGPALDKAGELLRTLGPSTHGVVALLTDGKVNYRQSVAAAAAAARLCGGPGRGARLYGLGVGRGMDRESMLRIIGAGEPAGARDRQACCTQAYAPRLGLMHRPPGPCLLRPRSPCLLLPGCLPDHH